MNVTFFGQFLLDQELITPEQLNAAIVFQRENNTLLGALALKHGFLKPEQVQSIIREQQQSYLKFGEVALKKKYLSEDQVSELLNLQGQNHVYLGEALTRRHYLNARDLNRELNRFNKEILQQNACLDAILDGLDARHVFLCAYKMTSEYFYRLGYAARIQIVDDAMPPDGYDNVFFMSLVTGNMTYYFGIYLSDLLTSQIVHGKQSSAPQISPTELNKEMAGIFYNLNLIICEEMNRKGVEIKASSLIVQPPENLTSWTTLRAETLIDPFYMVLGIAQTADA